MRVRTVCWLFFLAIAKGCNNPNPFTLEPTQLTAKEGSCVEIICKVTKSIVNNGQTYWFWMKDPVYNMTKKDFDATIIYSSQESERPVSPDFANRTTYIDSSSWKSIPARIYDYSQCSILICNLNKTDSGNYSFRYVDKQNKCNTWATKPEANLTVVDNPCPITFEKQPVVTENNTITLRCATLSSCPSSLQIQGLTPPLPHNLQKNSEEFKVITHSFNATWEDNGRVLSCQTQDTIDKYLIQNITLTVEYPPKGIRAVISSNTPKEAEPVTFTCSARGTPAVIFTWFKVGHGGHKNVFSGANWTIGSINDSLNGSYYCQAKNEHGEQQSNVVTIDVQYCPDVEILIQPETQLSDDKRYEVGEGYTVALICNVIRANPPPHTFNWYKGSTLVYTHTDAYHIKSIKPEDSGFYTCEASNTVGSRTSQGRQLNVLYKPMNTRISVQGAVNNMVTVGSSVTFKCNTDAYPNDVEKSLYSFKQTDPSQWTAITSWTMLVQRTDEACYICNASNKVGKGNISKPECIQVLFPPTKVNLSMDSLVTEGQNMTVNCTAESNPKSNFIFKRLSGGKNLQPVILRPVSGKPNTYQHTFTVTSTDAGVYKCEASNNLGTNNSMHRKLVVKYAPKEVKVEASQSGFVVNENQNFTLNCRANSFPNMTFVTWTKMTNGKDEPIPDAHQASFSVQSASPSDSGLYSCTVANEVGRNKSQQVEIKVKYAPKHIKITQGPVQQRVDGKRFVILSCSSHSYPPVEYSWYNKVEMGSTKLSNGQNITVEESTQQLGEYYCIAKNEISSKESEVVIPFDDSAMKVVKLFFLSCFILLFPLLMFLVCRQRTNKSRRRPTVNTWPCFGFLAWWNRKRSINQMNETRLVEPSRSRDDLLPDQPCRARGQQWQPHPDRTPALPINTVYCTVNLPKGQQAPSAQKPKITNGGHTESDSLNYASLQFVNKQKTPEDVYARVSKSNSSEEKEQENLGDYENVSAACAARPPSLYESDDTDTSDEEVTVNYSQVIFKPKFGQQRANRLSSSSAEETEYSEVKI
ncbi:B-cell receptor CD22 [Mugil cephalus]|uniref:B-cell receptor CD22 n=1 Tax=Mugil cephalus TaxID=48193 RepID=UPI001FB5E699|nr:B-cell receptor CD22 [Mugil cephalus]